MEKQGADILIKNIILEAIDNNTILNNNVDILNSDTKYFYKNLNYYIDISEKKIYFTNFKSSICQNFHGYLYLAISIEESDIFSWLRKKYNFIK